MGNPLPVSLPEECIKAQKILGKMVDPVHGVDGVVPLKVLEKAKGFAIFSVFRLGFLMSARGGSGIVIARTGPNSWSAPAALAIGGLGGGFNAGADVTDFLIVLNTARAVKAFMSTGSLQLGGNLSVAMGPVGRSAEAAAAVNSEGSAAAMYSYSRSKGVYAGLSVEGTVLLDRSDANSKAYNQSDCSAKKVLSGSVEVPDWALPLHDTVKKFTMTGGVEEGFGSKADLGGWIGTTGAIEGMSGDPYAEERAENERKRRQASSNSRDWEGDEQGTHSRWATDESAVDVELARQKLQERRTKELSATPAYAPSSNSRPGFAKRLGSFGRSSSHTSNSSRDYAFAAPNGGASFAGGASSAVASNYAGDAGRWGRASSTSSGANYRPSSSSSSKLSSSPKSVFSSSVGNRTTFKGESSLLNGQSGAYGLASGTGAGTSTGQPGYATHHISNRSAQSRGAGGGSSAFKQQFRNSTSSESADEAHASSMSLEPHLRSERAQAAGPDVSSSNGAQAKSPSAHQPSSSINADPFYASSPFTMRGLPSPSGPYALDRDREANSRAHKSSSSTSTSSGSQIGTGPNAAAFVFPRSATGSDAMHSPSGARIGAQGWRDDYGLSTPDGHSNGSRFTTTNGNAASAKRPDMRHRSSSSASRLWSRIRGNSTSATPTSSSPSLLAAAPSTASQTTGYFDEPRIKRRDSPTDLMRFEEEESVTPPFSPDAHTQAQAQAQRQMFTSSAQTSTLPSSADDTGFASSVAGPNGSGGRSSSSTFDVLSSSLSALSTGSGAGSGAETGEQKQVVALYDFEGQEAQDLSFRTGDVIIVLRATQDRQDWWLGRLANANAGVQGRRGVVGSFPANYTEDL